MFHIVSILSMVLSYKNPSCIMISLHEGVSVPPGSRTQSTFLITLYLVFLLLFRTLGLPLPVCVCVCVCVFSVAQTCPILCGPRDCSPTGSSAHGIFKARILECDAISYSRKSSQPRYWTMSLRFPVLAVNSLPLAPPLKPTMCQTL